jgi:uncharacterized protein with von Willebrand factor type A (vWA) domain
MSNHSKIRTIIAEELDLFNTPHHKNMAAKAAAEKTDYRKELNNHKEDHEEFMNVHATVSERRELLNRVSSGLNLSLRGASDFDKELKKLLDVYNL